MPAIRSAVILDVAKEIEKPYTVEVQMNGSLAYISIDEDDTK